jgi:hypothetical protein
VSFSFPVLRVSFTKSFVASPSSKAKHLSYDVYIGYHGEDGLSRFYKWLSSQSSSCRASPS